MLSELSVKKGQIPYDFTYEVHRIAKCIETEGRMEVAKGWRKRGWEVSV